MNYQISVYSIFVILFFICIQPAYSQMEITSQDDQHEKIGISLQTNNNRFLENEIIRIYGNIFDFNGNPTPSKILLEVTKDNNIIYQGSTFAHNGTFYQTLKLENVGNYIITATIDDNINSQNATSKISVIPFCHTFTFYLLVFGLFTFFVLILLMLYQKEKQTQPSQADNVTKIENKGVFNKREKYVTRFKNFFLAPEKRKIIHFAIITILSILPTAIFVTINFEIGTDAPIGLILKSFSTDSKIVSEQWFLNIGGHWSDKYNSAIQIPLYVFVFGIAGGYIRFLHVMLKDTKTWDSIENYRKYAIKDITTLFLSPLLAIVSYFFFLQSVTTEPANLASIAIISLASGVATKPIIDKLSGSIPSEDKDKPSEDQDKPSEDKENKDK